MLRQIEWDVGGMGLKKWTYHKEQSFVRNYFIFLKILFQFTNILDRELVNVNIHTFCKRWSFISARVFFFPASIVKVNEPRC